MYLVIGGRPSVSGRCGRLLSKDVNRHHASPWHEFDDIETANVYADDLLKRHPRWTVAVVALEHKLGKQS